MFLVLSTASCWETVGWSTPRTSWSSCTLCSPCTRISRTRMRSGCARALKNSALKTWSCPAPLDGFIQVHLYMNIRDIVQKNFMLSKRKVDATNSARSNQPDHLLVVGEHGTDHEAEGHQPVLPGTGPTERGPSPSQVGHRAATNSPARSRRAAATGCTSDDPKRVD